MSYGQWKGIAHQDRNITKIWLYNRSAIKNPLISPALIMSMALKPFIFV